MGLLYVHLSDHSAMGAPPVAGELKARIRAAFTGLFILAGGVDRSSAESALKSGQADLIAFARQFIANPDLVTRMRADAALNAVDVTTFYSPGPKGYIDYPALVAYLDVAAPATTVYVAKACNVRFLHPRTSTLGRGRASCLKSLDSGHSHA